MPSALSRRLDRIEAAHGSTPAGRPHVLDALADEARLRAALGYPDPALDRRRILPPPPGSPGREAYFEAERRDPPWAAVLRGMEERGEVVVTDRYREERARSGPPPPL
jgi:hypothetical protein